MTDYQKYINDLRKCANEHENDRTSTGHVIVSDLCRDTANLLEQFSNSEKPNKSEIPNSSTTKNDLADNKTFYEQIVEYCNEHFLVLVEKDVWEDARKALTTKNDLAVDCISRADSIKAMQNKAKGLKNEDTINGLCGAVAILYEMPSVTPQEPKWIPVSERLPDSDDEVLCWYEYYHWSQEKVLPEYGLGRYLKEMKAWFGEVANGKDVRVIAWMPLPTPYKPQEGEDKNDKRRIG